jgi:hypothetical protein
LARASDQYLKVATGSISTAFLAALALVSSR